MRSIDCMNNDWLWVIITIVLNLGVVLGYAIIARHWYKSGKRLENSPAKSSLQAMMNIFIFCGLCGYLSTVIRMYWPAWRLTDMAIVGLLYYSFSYIYRSKGLSAVYVELNESKKAKEDLHLFQQLSDHLPQLVWTATDHSSPDYFNHSWYEYTGLTQQQSMGEGWKSAVHPDDIRNLNSRWPSTNVDVLPETEFRLRSSKGDFIWHLNRCVKIQENEKSYKWIGSFTDINLQKSEQTVLQKEKDDGLGRLKKMTEELLSLGELTARTEREKKSKPKPKPKPNVKSKSPRGKRGI
jgi:PAS domain S-box-containing protein